MKKNKIKILLSLFFVFFLVTSCSWDDDKGDSFDRTLLIYIDGNNTLSDYAQKNFESIIHNYVPLRNSGDVLLVYYKDANDVPKLYRIVKDETSSTEVNQEIIMKYDASQISASSETLNTVLSRAHFLFPAKENGLILWSHGTGWLPEDYYNNPTNTSFSVNQMELNSFGSEEVNNITYEINIKDLASALPIKYDFIVFDACFMGGIEVAYQLKDYCNYFIASPAEILANGFPYDKLCADLFASNGFELSGLKNLCVDYFNSYKESSATIGLINTDGLTDLSTATKNIINTYRAEHGDYSDINPNYYQKYYRFNKHWFYDFADFITSLTDKSSQDYIANFESAMTKTVLYEAHTDSFLDSFDLENCSGLSCYIPNPKSDELYKYYYDLDWNKAVSLIREEDLND